MMNLVSNVINFEARMLEVVVRKVFKTCISIIVFTYTLRLHV